MFSPLQTEWDADLRGGDPLTFPGYAPPPDESVVTGVTADGFVLVEGRFDVMGGSMGAVHGERVARAFRRAADQGLPVVVVTRSGGARLQEGMVSLVQMARTAAAVRRHQDAGLLSVGVLGGPTTGGVFASYGSLLDLRAAEAGATIGFAGPRVVELTTGERVGNDSHTAESAFRHGLVDALVDDGGGAWVRAALGLAPAPALAVPAPFSGGVEVRGPDPAVRAWLAPGNGVVIATTPGSRIGPAGYRLAQRAISLADRLALPLVTFVDTLGADPSPRSEAGDVAGEIARTFAAMAALRSPSVSVCLGEGASGGALALAFADRLLMIEGSRFYVISPEGAAAILDRTTDTAARRAEHLKVTPADLLQLGIVDEVLRADPNAVRHAIERCLAAAKPGDRERRFDAATARWLSP